MVNCCVLFEVLTKFLNYYFGYSNKLLYTLCQSFQFKYELIENPDIMCIKGCWYNQNNNDYTTQMTKYKFKFLNIIQTSFFFKGLI
jgi:hypothetical protein